MKPHSPTVLREAAGVGRGVPAEPRSIAPRSARRYGIETFTRKNRVASFVGPQDSSTRLVFPSTL